MSVKNITIVQRAETILIDYHLIKGQEIIQ
jgi:hypothetical protein